VNNPSHQHKTVTLWLCGILHAFTHLYTTALIPLYLIIQKDFQLSGDGQAALLVTIQTVAYVLPSYWMGVLADKYSRKTILAVGLALNGVAFIALSVAPTYGWAMFCLVIAGFGGSFYHPAASAMVVRLFPSNPGHALGRVGIGAGVGFFVGPVYAGWRATTAGWRTPLWELGLLGVLVALAFYGFAEEEIVAAVPKHEQAVRDTWKFETRWLWVFLGVCVAFSLRDFAGSGMATLSSLFLQRAWGYDSAWAGIALGSLSLMAIISNPLFGSLSDRNREGSIRTVLFIAAGLSALMPWLPRQCLFPALLAYGFFFMASFPMVEAALMTAVPDHVRGRVMGFLVMFCGAVSSLAHWIMGESVKGLGPRAGTPAAFAPIYAILGIMIITALLGLRGLRSLRLSSPMHIPSNRNL
jgi:MFS family permease